MPAPESPDLLTASKKLVTSPHKLATTYHSQVHSSAPMPKDRHIPISSLVLTAQQLPAPPPKPLCASAGCFLCFCMSIFVRCTSLNALHTLCRSGSSGKQDLCSGEHNHSSTRQSNSIKCFLLERTKAEDHYSTI